MHLKRLFPGNTDIFDRIQISISLLIRVSLIIAIVLEVVNRRWSLLFTTSLIFLTTFLPYLIERRYRIMLPIEFEFVIVVFLYMALYLGEIHSYYLRYWWWDTMLHTASGIAFGFVGFIILYVLYRRKVLSANPFWFAVLAFFFSLGIGALWEVFEFGMDSAFGTSMQKSGLVDTMWDLIVDALGALVTSMVGFFYFKTQKGSLFGRLTKKFVKENPGLFGIG